MSTPIFDPEDSRLTAYALGETLDPADRAEVEHLLQQSPAARQAMKEIQDTTANLTAEYDQERHALEASAEPAVAPSNVIELSDRLPAHRRRILRPLLAVAATLFLVGLIGKLMYPRVENTILTALSPRRTVVNAPAVSGPGVLPEAALKSPLNNPTKSAQDETLGLASQLGTDVFKPEQKPSSPEAALSSQQPDGNKLEQSSDQHPASVPLLALNKQTDQKTYSLDNEVRSDAVDGRLPEKSTDASKDGASVAASAMPPAEVRNYGVSGGTGGRLAANGGSLGLTANAPAAVTVTRRAAPVAPDLIDQPPVSPPAKSAVPQLARVFKSESDFYRTEAGPAAGGISTALAPGSAPKPAAPLSTGDRAKVKFSIAANNSAPENASYEAPIVPTLETSPRATFNTAAYDHLVENPFLGAKENPLSTFSIDVDTASYANVRRFLEGGSLPPPDAVRLEELINYFPYDYAPPAADSDKPFAVHLEAASCPWMPEHRLVRIGIKGKEIAADKRPASNLVFLLDVSGSMMPPERLPLIKKAMSMMTEHLTENDRVAIVTYAGNSGLVLPSTTGDRKDTIIAALDRLEAGGSTNGASGIALAYKVAKEGFIKGGTNRVILATDGDFNVGVTSQGELIRLIQDKAKSGVFLSALGVGTDNYKDSTMQKLADKGNGNYHYIDRLEEARKVLVEQMGGTLVTIAKDVKIQVEFNPAAVSAYRLIGYEKRMLKKEDFNDDRVDAGEIGAGHSVTALYEVVPVGQPTPGDTTAVDALKYGAEKVGPVRAGQEDASKPEIATLARAAAVAPEMLTVKLRHKAPEADKSERSYEVPLVDTGAAGDFVKASPDFKFAAAVASFGLALRDSPNKGSATLGGTVELAEEGKGADVKGYRAEFIELARRAQAIKDAR